MEEAAPSRYVELEGCANFRDLGGYRTIDGRRTRWGRLYRADGLTNLSHADLAVLADELGIRHVIDLRTDLEVESRGRFRDPVDGVAYHHMPLTDTLPGAEQAPDWTDTGFVSRRYHSMLVDGTASVVNAITLLAEVDNLPAVFHCSVGKDRTGVMSAVILGLVGVPDEVIIADYALSKPAMERILEGLRRDYPDSADVVAMFAPVILSVEPSSMEGFLAQMRQTYGSFDGLAEALGLSQVVPRLRQSLLG